MRCILTIVVLAVFFCIGGGDQAQCDQDTPSSVVETATGPAGLLELEQQDKITVRALRAWGRLPDQYVQLAQKLRQEAGLDLLGADLNTIKDWISKGNQGDATLAKMHDILTELAFFIEQGEHLEWTAAADETKLPAGALVRKSGQRWVHGSAQPATPASQLVAVPLGNAKQEETPPPQVIEPASVVVAESVSAEGEGFEFRISEQTSGTFRARLKVEGLQAAKVEDDPYFSRMLPQVLPDNPEIQQLERKFFEDRSSRLPVSEDSSAMGSSYDLNLGFAQVDTPIVIRVDAPEDPVIPPEKDGKSYKIVGKSFLYLKSSEASGDAEIEYSDDVEGELRWTPRLDASTGRLVGPRAVGVYMAYRINVLGPGGGDFGTLRHDYRRIGWVVIAMPGDLYVAGDVMYEVGKEEPATASQGTQVTVPGKLDFELPPYTMESKEVRVSDDMRHVAWVDGEKEGQKWVVVNGTPGKRYDDVKGYSMRFSSQGETFCFQAELGDKEIPVCNGVDGALFKDIETLTMSPDGGHILVAGEVAQDVSRVFLDGVQIRETSARVSKGILAVDGTAAWIESGRDPQTGAEFSHIVTSKGLEGPKYSAIYSDPVFTRNRAELYYIAAKEDGERFLVRNEEELKPTMGSGYEFTVTPDSASYAYVAPCGQSVECLIVNGKIGPEYSDIWSKPVFNADGTRYAYVGKKGDESFLVVDESEFNHGYGPVKAIMGLTFSPDGQRWAAAFRLTDEEYIVLADGKEIGRGSGSPRKIVFSPDGSRIAWLEKQKKSWRAYLDGKAGPEVREIYDDDPPQFSPDGRHLIYFYIDGEKKMHVADFGGEDRTHEIIPPRALFTASGVDYLAIDGNRLRRESLPLK